MIHGFDFDPPKFSVIDQAGDFASASQMARRLAESLKIPVKLERFDSGGWGVCADSRLEEDILYMNFFGKYSEKYSEEEIEHESDDEYRDRVAKEEEERILKEIEEEKMGYVYSQAQSEDTGWYYGDE